MGVTKKTRGRATRLLPILSTGPYQSTFGGEEEEEDCGIPPPNRSEDAFMVAVVALLFFYFFCEEVVFAPVSFGLVLLLCSDFLGFRKMNLLG